MRVWATAGVQWCEEDMKLSERGNNKQREQIKRCDRSTQMKVQPSGRPNLLQVNSSHIRLGHLFGDIIHPRVTLLTTVVLCNSCKADSSPDGRIPRRGWRGGLATDGWAGIC